MDFDTQYQRLMAAQVAPWAERWEALTRAPLRVDMSEGYNGLGVFGARAGPYSSLNFTNVAHEMAHAIERVAAHKPEALAEYGWGLSIKSATVIMGRSYDTPQTAQASRREAAVVGIQQRLLEMVDHPAAPTLRHTMVKVLMDWMPDYFLGGSTQQKRRKDRLAHMAKAYEAWPPERVLSAWHHVIRHLPAPLPSPHAQAMPARRPRP